MRLGVQFSGSVAALVSQPLVILFPSQSRNGRTQVVVQAPLWQLVPGHAFPQAPQWLELVVKSAQVPSQHVSDAEHDAQGSTPPSLVLFTHCGGDCDLSHV